MEKIRVGNVFVFINTEQKLTSNSSSRWFVEPHNGAFFENMDQLKQAINDVINTIEENKWFGRLDDCIQICYSEENPVCLKDDIRIGLHRSGTKYEQDTYQFAHEFTHRWLNGKIPNQYKWFEETICNLISYIVMEKLYMKNVFANSHLAYALKYYQMTNYKDVVPSIMPVVLENPSGSECRKIQDTITRYLEPFIVSNNEILCDLQKLPNDSGINFVEYLKLWNKKISEYRVAEITLPNLIEKIYLQLMNN